MPQGARPQVARPRGGRARRDLGHDQYDFGSRGSVFQSYSSSGPRFPLCDDRFSQMGHGMFGVFLTFFHGK